MTRLLSVQRSLAAAAVCLALVAATLAGSATAAQAVTCASTVKTWNGGTGAWTDPMRWNPNGVPTSADAVRIQTGTTTMTGLTGTVCALTLDPAGGSIKLSGSLDVVGDLALGVGSVAADAGVTSAPRLRVGGNVALAANATLDGTDLEVAGGQVDLAGRTLTITGPASTRLENGASVVSTSNGGLAVVKNGARLFVAGTTSLQTPAALQLQDGATLDTGGAAATLGGSGILNWQAGQVAGDLTIAARTILDTTATRTVPAGSRLTNAGATDIAGGTLQVDGSLVNSGTLRAYPGVRLTSSTGAGSLASTATGVLAVGAADAVSGTGDVALAALPFRNAGVVSVVTGTRLLVTAAAVRLDPGSVVRDPYPGPGARGVVQIGAGSGLTVAGDTTMQQAAVVRLDGAGATLTGEAGTAAQLQGSGTLDWRSGTVAGSLAVSQAETDVTSGGAGTTRLLSGNLALAGPASVDSTQVSLASGASLQVLGTTTLVGPGAGLVRATPTLSGQTLTVAPTGVLRRAAPADPATAAAVVDVKVVNNGSLAVAGDLRLRAGYRQVKAAGPDPAAIPDPVTSLLGSARLSAVDGADHYVPLELAAGGLGGSGTVAATKLILGSTWLHPGFQAAAGSIRVEGDLVLSADSDVQLVLRDVGTAGQPKESDTLVVAPLVENGVRKAVGRATLAGRLTGVSAGTYRPAYGTTVRNLVRYTARTGSFGKSSSFGTPAGLGWRPRYDSSATDGDGPAVDLRLSDVAPPALGLARIPAFTQNRTQRVTYAAVDNRTGVTTYDGRWREGRTAAKTFGAWHRPKAWQRSTGTSRLLTGMRPGRTYCFSVRVRDKAGNTSAWTKPLCTARMLDDAALAATSGWSRLRGRPGFYAGTVSRTARQGAELRRRGTFTRVAVTAVRCPTCGTVRVLAGSKVLKTLSLKGKATEVFTWVSPIRARSTATVRLRVVSSGRPVAVDSFGLSR
jgi:hypothetical protein